MISAPASTNKVHDEHGHQLEPATLFNAELVDDPELASSVSLVNVEAEETAQCQRQVKTALLIFW